MSSKLLFVIYFNSVEWLRIRPLVTSAFGFTSFLWVLLSFVLQSLILIHGGHCLMKEKHRFGGLGICVLFFFTSFQFLFDLFWCFVLLL